MNAYLLAFGLTLAVEVPVYGLVLAHGGNRTWAETVWLAVMVNAVSHPFAFLVVAPLLGRWLGPAPTLIGVETAIIVGEAALLRWRSVPGLLALEASAAANVASLAVGTVLLH